jgi:transformation/transcription domain-associated protein
LDHLQKWTDPNRIRSQHIWREGTETDVAVAIIDLFVLLPHASHFVEPLVKTTIKLEACLPGLQANYTASPYRTPLSRYLNKHCQYTVSFFLQRLKTPLYNEMFQDIIAYPESKPLREFLTGKQSSVSLLNVCFERPLAIIRSEKTAASALSPGGSPLKASNTLSTNELFHVHGIHPILVSPTQKEAALKLDVDAKRKKLHGLQQELNRAKEALELKSGNNSAPTTEIEEAKRKHRVAKLAFDRGTKEFNESRQKYASEVAENKASQTLPDPDTGTTRPMTIEALELQHQGFRLVKTLIAHDPNYFKDHTDVLRAFRWLWRSKGRYLRLQNEDAVPPRYHYESKLLSMILVEYSENSPSDVDLLFELIRIFLQPSSCDFAFVRSALARAVTNLTKDQKSQVMHRFFALLSGESTEEIKTLSIQLVVHPMLRTSFHVEDGAAFLATDIPGRFVSEVLFNNGNHVGYGERLKVELLKMADTFLEFVPQQLREHGDDVAKFCLSLVKSEDILCKSWAYQVLCRHIAIMETTPKLVLQVYGALTRSHQPEGKEIVRAGLDLLVPAMGRRLTDTDKKKAIEYTNRVMFEEVNSIPQLAHIWSTVVSHPSTFYSNRNQIVRYMINSLTRLGLPPNAPAENRALAVSVVELVLDWHKKQLSDQLGDFANATSESNKRIIQNVDDDGHVEKKMKTADGPVATPNKKLLERTWPLLDQNMVCIAVGVFAS